ncbi:MAG TPA: oxygen-insensitive NAD(P)H nitroreductase [Accumulibacter sp.]|uniref:oxygen-insensitive NAD(P)H nitroreductase n=1 Tax=Accumulibacter sp. TaxID=2053492 RepID=UPI002B82BABE|nr:oxygen-insensitive NAD(P)H nitroreductase [Accumulibacter sp.]HMV05405.1 oxygen-insensitive NAD(P)H nitroreductase [Accumulibacter sp.]HND38593.1 oxygen-insensitive NAD(P)H nitroreductase [Accumulibacter sp.]
MDIAHLATTRHTCKAFDPARKIPPADFEQLRTLLRYAPSSVNSQPWHYVIAASDAGKARIAETLQGGYAYNEGKVRNASQVIVFCVRQDLNDEHLARLLEQEELDGRFASAQARAAQNTARTFYADLHRKDLDDARPWMERQVYLALGMLLAGAAALGIDACPMEGCDPAALDRALGLTERGYSALVMVALGYRSEADFNAALPKSRLAETSVFTEI